MRRTPQYLITYFHHLFNEPIKMQTFESRLIFQKRVYFLQEFGIPFGYSFGWYIKGPYSSELADDGFENESLSKLSHEDWKKYSEYLPKIESSDKEALKKANEFFEEIEKSEVSEDRLLEIISSLHFLKKVWFPDNYNAALEKLKKLKPKFSEREQKEAQELFKKFF